MIIAIGITVLVAVITIVYFKIKQMGRDEAFKKVNKKALKDAIKVKKRDIKHSNDSIDTVDKQLLKEARD